MKTNGQTSCLPAHPPTRLPWRAVLLAFLCSITLTVSAATNELATLLQKGLFEEEANHNLDAAKKAYESVVTQFDKDRKLAATAIFRLGEVLRKQGKTNEAKGFYVRIIREFPDQKLLVDLSLKQVPAQTASAAEFAARIGQSRESTNNPFGAATSAEAEEIRRIQALIKNSPDLINAVNVPLSAGEGHDTGAPLHKAARDGHLQVVTFLLANGADMEIKTTHGFTPLFLAVANGHRAMVELLASRGANIRASLPNDQTPLHVASGKGFRSIVELLLEKGADPNAKTQSGVTALHDAAAKGQKEIAELLISKGADINAKTKQGETPLFNSVRAGAPELAKLLLSKEANPNITTADGNTPLWEAVNRKQDVIVELLLKHSADINVKRDMIPNSKGYSLLHVAAMKGDPRSAALLLNHGIDVNIKADSISYAYTPLHLAAMEGSPEVLKILLAAKADMKVQDSLGNTPLHLSVRDSHLATSEMLIQAGADLNAQNSGQFTPLHLAVLGKQRQTVELLLKEGANPNTIASTGQTPLGSAKGMNPPALELIELLKQHGANENLERLTRISVVRPSANFEREVFFKKNNNFANQFTLFQAIVESYTHPSSQLNFPNFSSVKIRRLEDGVERIIPVNLFDALKSGDCSKDIPLQWGDLIEIPETDHRINDNWEWPATWRFNLAKCSERRIEIEVKGKTTPIVLRNSFGSTFVNPTNILKSPDGKVLHSSKWTTSVVNGSGLLHASSDVSRIKVKRTDPVTGKITEYQVSLATNAPPNDLWLRDGDVIEIPERDPNAAQQAPSPALQPAEPGTKPGQTRPLRQPPVQPAPTAVAP